LPAASPPSVGCAGNTEDAAADDNAPVTPVEAVSPQAATHLKGGANASPSFVDDGLALSASGSLSGLGNADLVVSLHS
jgi:hypothetical protein